MPPIDTSKEKKEKTDPYSQGKKYFNGEKSKNGVQQSYS